MLLLKAFLLLTVLIPMITSTTDVETRKKRSVSSYAVEGCYSLFPAANLTKQMRGHNSNVKCQETCRDKGYIFAATKGDQCQCGNVYPRGNKVNDSQCTSRCRSWSSCHGAQSCCGGPSAYTVSVVGNIDVAKEVLRRLSHQWQTNTGFRNYMKSFVTKPTTGDHEENWISFNCRGWSTCGRGRYMAGLYRHSSRSNDYIYLIEKAYCVDAPGDLYSAKKDQHCYDHNWWKSFNNKGWSTCKNGYYMTGLWRNSGNKLYHIEEAKCCRPKTQVTRWGECYNHNAWKSFNNRGWTKCKPGFYMAGLYRSSCHKLYCLEEFKCCKMGAYNGNSWVERPDLVIKLKIKDSSSSAQ
ncbi:uncharacterized protein LOC114523229 [Dendronephthya gigantea]|uniref:uncharacterized protein LOC114523229 n=1 Tax=Dendronephthya gigantea TaxID=151771 RepID=UPI00106925DE|nr:uncharacterized protein LOC114523229 [Dendronephthya gigantea]